MLNFGLLEKGLGIVYVCGFSRKIFLRIYSINWRGFIAWLSLLLEILINMCIGIVS